MFNRRNYPDFRIDPTADLGVEGRDGVDFEERRMDHQTDGLRDFHLHIPMGSCFDERTVDPTVPVIGDRTRPSPDDYYSRKLARLAAAQEADQ